MYIHLETVSLNLILFSIDIMMILLVYVHGAYYQSSTFRMSYIKGYLNICNVQHSLFFTNVFFLEVLVTKMILVFEVPKYIDWRCIRGCRNQDLEGLTSPAGLL